MSPQSYEALHEDIQEIKSKLDRMAETMAEIAVQDNRIKNLETARDEIRSDINQIKAFQATCPRSYVKMFWIPLALFVVYEIFRYLAK